VQSVDGQGNTATSSNQTFTTSSSTATFATLDPSNTSVNITLSNANLTGTCNTTNANGNVSRTSTSRSSGKYYFEITPSIAGSPPQGIGLINASQSVSGNWLGEAGNNSIGCYAVGTIYQGASHEATFASYTAGNTVGVAVDLDNKEIWYRVGNGNWNASGTANPATDTGGQDISAIAFPVFAAVELDSNGDVTTANFGATSYAFTPPIGFGNW
jgi:hypothetical protein